MEISFNQRFGINIEPVNVNVFPETARNGLMFVLEQLITKGIINNSTDLIEGWTVIYRELLITAKSKYENINTNTISIDKIEVSLKSLKWNEVYVFCERIYNNLLTANRYYESYSHDWIDNISIEEAKNEYTQQINTLLSEENLPFIFQQGQFVRPGKPQTQKNINRTTGILARPELKKVKAHFNKAIDFFSNPDHTDYQNSIKESLCSLELAAEILSGEQVSKDFTREMQKLGGSSNDKIPTPIISSMIKIFAYRGTGDGVAHGISEGLRVTNVEAELVLSCVAAFITYLVCFYDKIYEEIPF